MERWRSFFFTVVASVFLWMAVSAAKLVGANDDMFNFTVFAAFGGTVALWLVFAFTTYSEKPAEPSVTEKAKRSVERPDDARLALLLELMDDEDRRALKRRLMDDLAADGEATSLAALLDTQDDRSGRSAGR